MKPSEYGGSDGLQPPPHTPTPAETLRLLYALDPADVGAIQ